MRSRMLVLIVAVAWGCVGEAPTSPTTPTVTALAKGGKPTSPSITLNEYWVEALSDGSSLIHMAGEGSAIDVNLSVSHDFFTNGEVDDNFSQHFEYSFGDDLPLVPVTVEDGSFHVDMFFGVTLLPHGVLSTGLAFLVMKTPSLLRSAPGATPD